MIIVFGIKQHKTEAVKSVTLCFALMNEKIQHHFPFFFFFFFFFIDCSYIYKHYINSVIITLLTDIIKTNNTLRTTVTILCKLTLLEIKEKKETYKH